MQPKLKLAVLISGKGSNMIAIHKNCQQQKLLAEIICVISNNKKSLGISYAKANNIPTHIIEHQSFNNRADFDQSLSKTIKSYNPDLVCLAGFMRILTKEFIQKWDNKIINIHPSLLPSFKGVNAQQQALTYGVKITGCTVHFVTEKIDSGKIILQKPVIISETDDLKSLSNKILSEEHIAYSEALSFLNGNKLLFRNVKNGTYIQNSVEDSKI